MADKSELESGWGITELALAAVLVLSGVVVVMILGLYAIPRDIHDIPETQPAVRVTREADFQVGASRLVRWGERPILVVRADSTRYYAVQGMSPSDGCVLTWEEVSSRIVSPCSHVVYDVNGNVVTGLTTQPLTRYRVFARSGVVYVSTL